MTDWWCCRPIYIGPQQQSEPDGTGDGWWPATQPRVTLADIRLSNITSTGGTLPHPGVLRCNASNPCEGFVIDAVRPPQTSADFEKEFGLPRYLTFENHSERPPNPIDFWYGIYD